MTQARIGFLPLLLVLIVAELVCGLESNMIYVALTEVYRSTGDPVHAGWLITAFTLTSAGAAAICGRLGDLYGRKMVLVVAIIIALAGSTLSAVARDLDIVIVGRALQGASMAILPLCYGLLREHAPAHRVPLGVGVLGGTYSIGVGAGTMIGGFIVDHFPWQGIFFASAGLAVVALLLVGLVLPASSKDRASGTIDLAGGLLFFPAIALVLLGLTFLRSFPWYQMQVAGLIGCGFALLALWIWHELRIPNPLMSVRLLADRRIALANLGMFAFSCGPVLIPLVTVPLLQQPSWSGVGFGLSAAFVGSLWMVFSMFAGGWAIASGYLATRFGSRSVVLAACAILVLSWGALLIGGYSSIWIIFVISALALNPSTTVIYAMIPSLIIEASPEDRTSEATGLTQVIRSVGLSLGSLLIPFMLSTSMATGPAGERLPDATAYTSLFAVLTLIASLSLACIMGLPRPVRRRSSVAAAV